MGWFVDNRQWLVIGWSCAVAGGVHSLMWEGASWVWLVGEYSTSRGRWYFFIGSYFRGWLIGGSVWYLFVGDRLWLLVTGRFNVVVVRVYDFVRVGAS